MARQMKDSGVAWIGMMPDGWRIEKGKHVLVYLERPIKDTDSVVTCFRDGQVTLRSNRRELGFTVSLQEIGYKGVDPGDLVVHGMDGFAGSIGISDSRGKCSPVLNILDSEEDKTFLMYYLRMMAYGNVFLALSTGIRERTCDTNWNKLKELPYPVPGRDVQNMIASTLTFKCSEIDKVVEQTRATIEEYKKLKQAIITEAVTKGVRGPRSMKPSGVEWIGDIPEEWGILKTLWLLEMPITDGPHETPILYDEGIPFISAEAVSCGRGRIDFSHKRGYISKEYYDECCKKYTPRLHDIYMIKSGATTGRVSMVDTEEVFTIWSPLAVLRANQEKMLPRFLFYSLQADYYQKQISLSWSFGTQQNIGMRVLEQLKIATPDADEQQEIATYLDIKCAEIDRIIEKKEQLIEELGSYKKSLIYEYVTGKKEVTA